jgi:hypothetical protein
MLALPKRSLIGVLSVLALAAAPMASAQAIKPGENIDKVLASSKFDVVTGENLNLPRSGDWHARWKETDFPVIRKLAENVYLYQAMHNAPGWITNSLIVVTSDGVVVLDGQGRAGEMQRMVEEVKKLTPQPIKYIVVGSPHADHGENLFATTPGVDQITFVGHAITKVWFEHDAITPDRNGVIHPIPPITNTVGEIPEDPTKPPPHVTKVMKIGGEEFDILYRGRGHAGPDLETYLPKEKILWMSEGFESRQIPSMGDSSYPREWIAMLKELAVMKNVDNYLGAHGFMDSPAINKEEYLNNIRTIQFVFDEGKRLHDAGVPITDVPNKWHFGPHAHDFFSDSALPDITAVYMDLDGTLPPCPMCRPRRYTADRAAPPAE